LREGLDAAGFHNVGIMSYSAKYASAFTGHFVMHYSAPVDNKDIQRIKKTYQMDYANRIEAVKEALWDVEEGQIW
jgi:porphobilinogen synthase